MRSQNPYIKGTAKHNEWWELNRKWKVEQHKKYTTTLRGHFYTFLKRTRHKNGKCNISINYLEELWEVQRGKCALSGVELVFRRGHTGVLWNSASLDRIVPSKGYVIGNVRWVAFQVNMAKGHFPDSQLIETCKYILKHFGHAVIKSNGHAA